MSLNGDTLKLLFTRPLESKVIYSFLADGIAIEKEVI